MVPERQMAFDDQSGLNGDGKRSDMNPVYRCLMVSVTPRLRGGRGQGICSLPLTRCVLQPVI